MMKVINYLKSYLFSGSERSVKAKKNILQMLIYKGGNIVIGLLLVPMTINYVNSENYGIWLTLSSMVAWMSFFNIGLNSGLKNRLAEALANNDYVLGKKYVSTTYAMLTLIFVPLMLILLFVAPYINWASVLNISQSYGESLLAAICILIVYFCLNFILSTINVVIMAEQRPADASMRDFVQQLTSLLFIWVLTLTTEGSLLKLCMALCISPLIIVTIFNFTLFRGRYKKVAPSFKTIDFKLAPDLLGLSVKFFIIQIAAIVQYQMINFLIMRYYGASEVTSYNIAFKYFSVVTMLWGIVTTPIWAATTDAFSRGDITWIRNAQKKYVKIFLVFLLIGILMLFISPVVYHLWIGDSVDIPFVLSSFVLLYNYAMMFGTIFVSIVNGSGKLNIQVYASIISPIVFLATFFLCHYLGIGIISVLIAAIVSNFNGLVLAPIQCRSMLSNK